MNWIERLHQAYGSERRARVLASELARRIPDEPTTLLDVGCGDGRIAALIARERPQLVIEGIDVLVRDDAAIPVRAFDGRRIPHEDDSFDHVLFVDVLHHSDDPGALLGEGCRVARRSVLIKDHRLDGLLAGPTLRFMDRVGNERFGVSLPFNYWPEQRWREAFDRLGLEVESWTRDVALYPWPLSLVFGRGLHYIARLGIP